MKTILAIVDSCAATYFWTHDGERWEYQLELDPSEMNPREAIEFATKLLQMAEAKVTLHAVCVDWLDYHLYDPDALSEDTDIPPRTAEILRQIPDGTSFEDLNQAIGWILANRPEWILEEKLFPL
jgi:hypothetical protein